MTKTELSTLIQYNAWANNHLLTTCEKITHQEFTRAVTPDPGWGSLRGILVHTLDTEFGWRASIQPDVEDIILNEADFPDLSTLKQRWLQEQSAWSEFMLNLDDRSLNQGYGKSPQNSMKLWQVTMHVLFHSMQHRSEVAAILTGIGHSPGELDLAVYLRQNLKN